MTILFSPVGTADPVTSLGDGPMLHIVRWYKPDKVVLFLSPKMAGYQNADRRYTEAIKLLCKHTGQKEPSISCVTSKRTDVQRFDAYISEFEDCLGKLRKSNKGARIIANVSSGTPAMEQALVAWGAFGEYDLTLVQVPTPRGDINHRDDREKPDTYDLELLWGCDPDNDEHKDTNRCEEVALPNFKDQLIRQNVLALIDAYDYEAAAVVAQGSANISSSALNLIKGAANRLNLSKIRKGQPQHKSDLDEYLQMLDVRLKQGHWGDFVRCLTPAYTWSAKFALERSGLPQSAYIRYKTDYKTGVVSELLDEEKVSSDDRLRAILGRAIYRSDRAPFLANWMLDSLVGEYCPEGVSNQLDMVRTFEEGSRNELAHQLFRADKAEIEHRGGATFEQVMDALFKVNGMTPGKYDEINRQIRSLL